MPEAPEARLEVRRLVDWFNVKLFNEVTHWLVTEKVYKRFMSSAQGGGAPEMELVRAARSNIRHHLRYIGLSRGPPELARRRGDDGGRPRRGGASLLRGFSGRRAMGRGRHGEDLVRAGEVAPLVPRPARRPRRRHHAGGELRRIWISDPEHWISDPEQKQGRDSVSGSSKDSGHSWPASSRPPTRLPLPHHARLEPRCPDVDGRDKPGHDGNGRRRAGIRPKFAAPT